MTTTWRTAKIFGRPWQDVIFAIGEIVFLVTLIPLFFANTHIPFWTGMGTGFMLYTFVAAHVSYRNWMTVTLSAVTATIWVLLGLGIHL